MLSWLFFFRSSSVHLIRPQALLFLKDFRHQEQITNSFGLLPILK